MLDVERKQAYTCIEERKKVSIALTLPNQRRRKNSPQPIVYYAVSSLQYKYKPIFFLEEKHGN